MTEYLAVTNDRLELILASGSSTTELADSLGCHYTAVLYLLKHKVASRRRFHGNQYKIVKVEVDDYEVV